MGTGWRSFTSSAADKKDFNTKDTKLPPRSTKEVLGVLRATCGFLRVEFLGGIKFVTFSLDTSHIGPRMFQTFVPSFVLNILGT